MTTTTFDHTVTTISTVPEPVRGVLRPGLVAGAAAAVTLVVLVAQAAGASVDIGGEAIPLVAFAQLTMVGALVGTGLARLARRVRRPRAAFVRTTTALTALSVVPDVLADASAATRVLLATTHVLAATIIVPVLARRLAR